MGYFIHLQMIRDVVGYTDSDFRGDPDKREARLVICSSLAL